VSQIAPGQERASSAAASSIGDANAKRVAKASVADARKAKRMVALVEWGERRHDRTSFIGGYLSSEKPILAEKADQINTAIAGSRMELQYRHIVLHSTAVKNSCGLQLSEVCGTWWWRSSSRFLYIGWSAW
jgi:hypothetical protein